MTASVNDPFHVSNCSSLGFAPSLSLKLIGKTHAAPTRLCTPSSPSVPATPTSAAPLSPCPTPSYFAQEHLVSACAKSQFEAHACPADSIYGQAGVTSPLLEEPLEGPVYLGRASATCCPTWSSPCTARTASKSTSTAASTRSAAACAPPSKSLPDAPASEFELTLFGGKRGLLVNSATSAPLRASPRPASSARTTPAMRR